MCYGTWQRETQRRWLCVNCLWTVTPIPALHWNLGSQQHFRLYGLWRNLWKKKREKRKPNTSSQHFTVLGHFWNFETHILYYSHYIQAKNFFSTITRKGGSCTWGDKAMEKINCHPFRMLLKSIKCRCVVINSTCRRPTALHSVLLMKNLATMKMIL